MRINSAMTRLQSYLDQANLRQSEFAALVGASQATISKLARGAVQPGLDLAVAIERATAGAVLATSWVPEPPSADAGQTQPPEADAA